MSIFEEVSSTYVKENYVNTSLLCHINIHTYVDATPSLLPNSSEGWDRDECHVPQRLVDEIAHNRGLPDPPTTGNVLRLAPRIKRNFFYSTSTLSDTTLDSFIKSRHSDIFQLNLLWKQSVWTNWEVGGRADLHKIIRGRSLRGAVRAPAKTAPITLSQQTYPERSSPRSLEATRLLLLLMLNHNCFKEKQTYHNNVHWSPKADK